MVTGLALRLLLGRVDESNTYASNTYQYWNYTSHAVPNPMTNMKGLGKLNTKK